MNVRRFMNNTIIMTRAIVEFKNSKSLLDLHRNMFLVEPFAAFSEKKKSKKLLRPYPTSQLTNPSIYKHSCYHWLPLLPYLLFAVSLGQNVIRY